jgi:hypothetical protein
MKIYRKNVLSFGERVVVWRYQQFAYTRCGPSSFIFVYSALVKVSVYGFGQICRLVRFLACLVNFWTGKNH